MRVSATPRAVRVVLWAMAAWVVGYELSAVLPSHPVRTTVFSDWVSEGVQLTAAVLCAIVARRLRGHGRVAWGLIAAGLVAWTAGDIYWLTVLDAQSIPPIPSPADAAYLICTPLVFAGVLFLVKSRVTNVSHTVAVDGVIVALAAATVSAALVIRPVIAGATGNTMAVATNLAYPITDLMPLAVVLGAVALRGWRLDRTWALLGAGVLAFFITDSLYLVTSANGTYMEPSPFDFGWVASMVLFAAAAWAPAEPPRREQRVPTTRDIVLPLALAFTAIMVTLLQPDGGTRLLTVALGAACTAAVMVRLVITFRENVTMLKASRVEALADALTGLGNRRALAIDLERGLESAHDGAPLMLVLFDLDGFKHYNDSFGHPAGDALLTRLGRSLERSVTARGRAYRVGGDEFCALLTPGTEVAQPLIDAAAAALSDHGEGFTITCSHGTVTLPREAGDPAEALRLADQRMYATKNGRRVSAGHQSKNVLLRAMSERDGELATHVVDVAALAHAVACRLGLDATELAQVRDAAELHDIGKVAIPDAILHKPGPLDEAEWEFIRGHTLIGERIIAAAPSLGRVAKLVRSSHERFDGTGYPDALAGQDIPLGARIVAVCDAFDAMVTDRSYRAAMAPAAALDELRRCGGSQFDPAVVQAFSVEWATRSSPRATAQP